VNPQRWAAVGDLFDKAVALPPGDRTACVERESHNDTELRREVLSLIASHDAAPGGFVQDKIRNAVLSFQELKATPTESTHVGPYRLIRELGRGGMGVVFLAERDDQQYKSTVAIKLVRPGMDTEFVLARFQRERQTLARLQHPNIARLLDGGTTSSGLPYIVMEYVDGVSITKYAEMHKLDVAQRVRLFLQVCAAVDYAHRNFIIHRDLKPGNMLVDGDGRVKLLDFGICKLLPTDPFGAPAGGETLTGLMTPSYASPEQVRGEAVALLSDIYSMGVVLYELLTGERPHKTARLTPHDVARSVVEGAVSLPSTAVQDRGLSRQLRGDLDNIVMHALETAPQQRYESAALMADDLRRYLRNEPVRARPQTASYRAYKFARRHVREVGAVCVLFLVLAAGLIASIRAQRLADARLAQVHELANKLVFDVHDSVKDLPGSTPARKLIVQTAVQYLDATANALKGDTRAELELASAYRRLGEVQGNAVGASLGDAPSAMVSYQKAQALLEDVLHRKPSNNEAQKEQLLLLHRIGSLQEYTGKSKDALQTLQSAASIGAAEAAGSDIEFKTALGDLYVESSDVKRNLGDYAGSLDDANRALQVYQQVQASGAATPAMLQSVATAEAAAGMAEGQLGHLQEELRHYGEDVALMEKLVASDPQNASLRRDLMLAYGHAADVLGNPNIANLGDHAGATQEYQKAAAIGKQLYDADPSNQRAAVDYGIVLSRLASVMDDSDFTAKAAAHRASLEVLKKIALTSPTDWQIQNYLVYGNLKLGETLSAGGDLAGAEKAFQDAVAVSGPARASGQISFATMYEMGLLRLARTSVALGQRERALEYAKRGLDASTDSSKGALSPFMKPRGLAVMGLTYAALAQSKVAQPDDRAQAISWLNKALDAWHGVEKLPSFAAPHQREMHEAEQTMASLEKR
jgi:tetratricopeptide (TPR) repeat protein